jgi:hypothetical protein
MDRTLLFQRAGRFIGGPRPTEDARIVTQTRPLSFDDQSLNWGRQARYLPSVLDASVLRPSACGRPGDPLPGPDHGPH